MRLAQEFFGTARNLFGGARRDRTADLYNAIVALSQLSYGPENKRSTIAQKHLGVNYNS